jgi:hypothetical protein
MGYHARRLPNEPVTRLDDTGGERLTRFRQNELLFSFVHVTDTHYDPDGPSGPVFRRFIEMINDEQRFPRPDFVVHTGDIVRGYYDSREKHEAQLREAKRILDRLRVPAYYACHNHDTYGEAVRGTFFDRVFGHPHFQEIEQDGFYLPIFAGALTSSDIFGSVEPGEEPPQWGFDVYWPRGLRLLRRALRAHRHQHALVFHHQGLVTPRLEPVTDPPDGPPQSRGAFWYSLKEEQAAPMRAVLEQAGNVVAAYSGHCHLNCRTTLNGIEYVNTSSLANYPGEVRLVRVFRDRLEHEVHRVPGGEALPIRWPGTRDRDHADPWVYSEGNPHERVFTVALNGAGGAHD